MTNLENIISKILEEADLEAKIILEEAQEKKESIIHAKIQAAHIEKERLVNKAKGESELLKERLISNANLKKRDEILSAKQDVLTKVFKLAKQSLLEISDDQYKEFLQNSLGEIHLTNNSTLVVPENKRKLVEELKLPLNISNEESVESGFLVKDDQLIMNYTFEFLVEYYREELEPAVLQEVFREME